MQADAEHGKAHLLVHFRLCLIGVCLRFEHGEHRVGEDDAVQDRIVFYGKQFLCQRIGSLYRQILVPVQQAVELGFGCFPVRSESFEVVFQFGHFDLDAKYVGHAAG